MTDTTIQLRASADYGHSGQYVARITGRSSKFTFEREFVGTKAGKRADITTAYIDEPGLYERRDVTRKGKRDSYVVVVPGPDGALHECKSDTPDAMKIAKALDEGRAFLDVVRYNPENAEADYDILTPAAAVKAQAAQTVESAIAACWAAIEALPPKEAKKVLAGLREKLNPPTEQAASTDTSEAAPESEP